MEYDSDGYLLSYKMQSSEKVVAVGLVGFLGGVGGAMFSPWATHYIARSRPLNRKYELLERFSQRIEWDFRVAKDRESYVKQVQEFHSLATSPIFLAEEEQIAYSQSNALYGCGLAVVIGAVLIWKGCREFKSREVQRN